MFVIVPSTVSTSYFTAILTGLKSSILHCSDQEDLGSLYMFLSLVQMNEE